MDYSRLSRETLIHEINRLNRELEREKLFKRAEAMGMSDLFEASPVPIYSVGLDYGVLWANTSAFEAMTSLDHKKCYQLFFGREDICPGCKVETLAKEKRTGLIRLTGENESVEIHQFPLKNAKGIIEIHIPLNEKEQVYKALNEALEASLVKQKVLESELAMHQSYMAQWIKMIRTPLRALNGYFQMDVVQRPYYLDTLKNTSQKLYELLSKLMVFEMQGGHTGLEIEPFNLKKTIQQATDQARLYLTGMGMVNAIELKVSSTIPEVIKGDGLRLYLMVSYLYEWLLIKTAHEPILCEVLEINQTNEEVHLNISMRSKSSKVSDYKTNKIDEYAAEIGSQIVTEIANKLNHKLDVKASADGEYTIQVICRFDKFVPLEPVFPPPKDPGSRKKILIADYEKPEIGLDFFESYELYFAKDGSEAVALYFDVQPDLTLINVAIESPDGFEVFDEIQRRRLVKAPVIAISTKLIDNEKLFMQDYGFDDYYPKPLTGRLLREIIKAYE